MPKGQVPAYALHKNLQKKLLRFLGLLYFAARARRNLAGTARALHSHETEIDDRRAEWTTRDPNLHAGMNKEPAQIEESHWLSLW